MMSWFFDAVPYITAVGTILLGASEIRKDWPEYNTSKLRITVASAFILVAVLSLVGLYHDKQEKKAAEIKADGEMKALQGKADAAAQAQKDNTNMYINSFAKMSGQISDLKAEVKTEALQKKLDAVQEELRKNQKVMVPAKVELTFTFPPFDAMSPTQPVPVREVTVPLQSDGSIHTEFRILNRESIDAVNVSLNIVLCDECKFAKEPVNSSQLAGMADRVRFVNFPAVHALEVTNTINLDIIPPARATQMVVGFSYRCITCSTKPGVTPEMIGTIHIVRPY